MKRYLIGALTESASYSDSSVCPASTQFLATIIAGNITGVEAKFDLAYHTGSATVLLIKNVVVPIGEPAELKGYMLGAGEKFQIKPHTQDISISIVGVEEAV